MSRAERIVREIAPVRVSQAEDLRACARQFDVWMANGRTAPKGLSFVDQIGVWNAFRRGWRSAGRSDFGRRRYFGHERRAYLVARMLTRRPSNPTGNDGACSRAGRGASGEQPRGAA